MSHRLLIGLLLLAGCSGDITPDLWHTKVETSSPVNTSASPIHKSRCQLWASPLLDDGCLGEGQVAFEGSNCDDKFWSPEEICVRDPEGRMWPIGHIQVPSGWEWVANENCEEDDHCNDSSSTGDGDAAD